MKLIGITFLLLLLAIATKAQNKILGLEKMNLMFETWKNNQIQFGNIRNNCNNFDLEKWVSEKETRFGLNNERFDASYADINSDGVLDGIFKIYFEDCAQGNGDVGTPKYTEVLIISNAAGYNIDDFYIPTLKLFFKRFKQKHTQNPSERIYNFTVNKNEINGDFKLWRNDDCYACSSLKGWFNINYKTKEFTFNLMDSNTNSFIETKKYNLK